MSEPTREDEAVLLAVDTASPAGSRAIRAAWIMLAVYIAFDMLLPLIRIPPHRPSHLGFVFLVLLPTAIFMFLQVRLALALVDARWRTVQSIGVMALGVVLWLIYFFMPLFARRVPLHLIPTVINFRDVVQALAISLFCTSIGVLLSRIIRERNMLLPVALIAMPIDYLGAMTSVGFTNTVVKHAPNIVASVSVPVPHVGGLHPLAIIGPGDALFMAFFFAVVQRLNLNRAGTFWWMYALLTVAMLLVIVMAFPIAALVPMGLAVLIANGRYFKLKRDEIFAMVYAIVFVLALVCIFYFVSHKHLFGGT